MVWRLLVVIVVLVLAVGLVRAEAGAPPPAGVPLYKGYETQPYRVERSLGAAEIRAYGPSVVAEVAVRGPRATAASRGFRILAGYIFGQNTRGAEIAMTAPAEVEPRRPDGTRIAMTTPVAMAGRLSDPQAVWTIRFTLPAQWTLADLPRPRDAHVRLAERPARRVLVLRFAGAPGDALLAEKAAEITALARAQGLHAAGPVEFQFYDPPLTLPFNRRNEAVLPLR